MFSSQSKRYVAIDLDESRGKVILATVSGTEVSLETVHSFSVPVIRLSGNYFWNLYSVYDSMVEGLTEIGSRGLAIESIGISAWSRDFICVSKDGSFLGLPRCGIRPYTGHVSARFSKKMNRARLFTTTGAAFSTSLTALQFFAQRKEKNLALDNADSIVFIPDALAYMLTGKRVCEFTSLSASGLLDIHEERISKDVLGVCKVNVKKFPAIVHPGFKIGRLDEDIALATGLGRVPVVAVASSRTASAVASIAPKDDRFAFLIGGARTVMGFMAGSPMLGDQMLELGLCNEFGIGGKILITRTIEGTDLLSRCLQGWRRQGKEYTPEQISSMISDTPASSAQLDPEDPNLAGATDVPSAVKRYCSLRSMEQPSDDAALVSLIVRSMAEKTGEIFRTLQSVCPFKFREVHFLGEGAADSVLNSLVSEECCVPVIAGSAEASALGNAMVQAGL